MGWPESPGQTESEAHARMQRSAAWHEGFAWPVPRTEKRLGKVRLDISASGRMQCSFTFWAF